LDRFFGKAFIFVVSSVIAVSAASADAYVNQLDQNTEGHGLQQMSTGTGPAYIQQLPADSRPVVVRPQKNRQVNDAAAKSRAHELAARKRFSYPNVGTGVSLALAAAKADTQIPTVGRGVVKR
jgi:hypothetical protein